jgi:signal transduction histidine kinase
MELVMERQDLPQSRQDSDVHFHQLIAYNADGMIVVNHSGIVRFVNPAAERLLQRSAQELIGEVFGFPIVTNETTELDIVAHSGDLTIAEMRVVHLEWEGESAYLASLRNITARKRTEAALRQREEQLRQAQKMEAVGRLAGGVAHEFNNLLTAILGYSDRLQRHLDNGEIVAQCTERISYVANRAALVARQLLTISRDQPLQSQLLNWNPIITETEQIFQPLIGASIKVVQHLSSDLWQVQADPIQLQQILMNLVLNARDAMAEGGELTLTTANVTLQAGPPKRYLDAPDGPYVMLEVKDMGIGVDTEAFPHLFEPFFTTKEVGNGTGLGLAVVYGIVQQNHGDIAVHSTPERGTSFRIYLPRSIDAPAIPPLHAPAGKPVSGSETILLVEDEELVRELLCEMLQRHGYRVLVAAQGHDALQLCAYLDEAIHLLVTDVVMPHMNGYELVARLTAVYPDLRVLLISGYVGEIAERNDRLPPYTAFLQKPFTPDVLAAKVRDVFDAL